MAAENEELLDYEEEEEVQPQEDVKADPAKKGYVGIHSTTFKDFLLKAELMRAIQKHGFEHPSEGLRAGCDACQAAPRRWERAWRPLIPLLQSRHPAAPCLMHTLTVSTLPIFDLQSSSK